MLPEYSLTGTRQGMEVLKQFCAKAKEKRVVEISALSNEFQQLDKYIETQLQQQTKDAMKAEVTRVKEQVQWVTNSTLTVNVQGFEW